MDLGLTKESLGTMLLIGREIFVSALSNFVLDIRIHLFIQCNFVLDIRIHLFIQ